MMQGVSRKRFDERVRYRLWGGLLVLLLLAFGASLQAQAPAITAPASGDAISGVVTVTGSAGGSDFLRYELAFLRTDNPGAGWIVFAEGDQPIGNGTLAVWDTTVGRAVGAPVFPDGSYQLRLRIVHTDYNYNEYINSDIQIFNSGPTPTPTRDPILAPPVGTPTITPVVVGAELEAPEILPTLTPLVIPTPQTVAADGSNVPPAAENVSLEDRLSLPEQLGAVNTAQFGSAFRNGARYTFYAFALLGVYLLLRMVLRWAWRFILSDW